jgi:hypothetical protein
LPCKFIRRILTVLKDHALPKSRPQTHAKSAWPQDRKVYAPLTR